MTEQFDEETARDYFVPYLNSISKEYSTTAETFNKAGKTDIIIKNQNGENVFIAEFKIWRGKKYLLEAITQLLERYVNWRDEKLALIVINKNNSNFTEIIEKAIEAFKEHPNFQQLVNQTDKTAFSFFFTHPVDKNKTVRIELILFNFK